MTGSLLEALDQRVLVCDGAMGTVLYGRGIFLNRCFDELNVTQPAIVADVHQSYVRAGADVLETNTFGANRVKLLAFGLAGEVAAINEAGARLARQAAGDAAWVAGSIGPLGVRIEPWGKTGVDEAEAAFAEQAAALARGGVEAFVLETFRDLNELTAAIRAVRAVSALPIIAQMTTEEDGNSLDGTPPEAFTPAIENAGADVIGLNCSVGPAAMLETIERMARLTARRLSAQPNAGRPRDVDGRNLYLCSPEYMASYARRFIAAGVRLVGGCCGTTPDHIRQIKAAVRTLRPSTSSPRPAAPPAAVAPAIVAAPVPRRDRSNLARAFADGEFVVLAEIATPRGVDLTAAVALGDRYERLGAIGVNIPDYPRSGARASALALAALVAQRGRLEPLLHYACRDRTLVGMQSDLVGAHAVGVRNILLTTGAPAAQANYTDATSVFDVDAIGLTNLVARLNRGLDMGGQPIGAPTRFHIGVAVNPFAPDPATEWRRLDHKVQAGADFLMTPPILDLAAFEAVLPRLRSTGLPVLAGLAAIDSLRQVEFLASEVTGARVADDLLDRLRRASDETAEGVAVTTEIAHWLRAHVQGVHITTLHGSPDAAERLIGDLDAAASRRHRA